MLNRRLFLQGSALIGCSAAAHPLMSTATFAAAPGENRLVVIILRGAMDGLDLVQPRGDADFAAYRPGLAALAVGAEGGALPLDDFWAAHPGLAGLMPLWLSGELGFVHATSTPYRDKRSHFDGQDLLEAGTGMDALPGMAREGWLNRMLQVMPDVRSQTAFSVGAEEMLILAGAARAASWTPSSRLELSAQARLLLDHVYHDDPLFRDAATEAVELSTDIGAGDKMAKSMVAEPNRQQLKLAEFAAARLREETRIASFSVGGWDTHRNQPGVMMSGLQRLSETVLALKAGLGPVWGRTTVLAMTEFGRTVRENGSRGTDHGTGGAMLVAGGAVRGGRVHGRWPGLAEADLYAGRDLMPTSDVRAWAGWAMRGLYGLDTGLIERTVFPGLEMGGDPGLLL
ncbi:DUF1501 domain-containing protein [Frigidibacter mobilis]|uniref:DUF1501 domain-containing protein n=1 Tax=Frigidibacter mobilis TaxID=1335048 RepID=A0A159Z0L8_9RHOB|nr:DUF1501 domain-containing protein [Frigidibacter mobilis]AMY68415.1 hypothetical protein AKL17_1159 [Frigidibacter mobilis]